MAKCKLFSISEKKALVAKGVITEDNKVIDSGLLASANAEFAADFKKIYGKEVTGIGRNKEGTFVVNAKAASIEEATRTKADARYTGVELLDNYSKLPGGITVRHPLAFSERLMKNVLNTTTKNFKVEYPDDSVRWMVLGDVMKEFPNSGFTKYADDLLNSQLDLVAGLSIPTRVTLNNYLDKGKALETKTIAEAQAVGNTRAYMDEQVVNDSNIDENLQAVNAWMDEVLDKTNTEFAVVIERNNDMSVQGLTNGGVVSLNPFAIGTHGNSLSYVYMHEKAHVVTMGLLNSDPAYRAKMEDLYEQAQAAGITDEKTDNLLEFAAEALSNPQFQQALKNVQTKDSLWDQFVKALAEAFKRATGIEVGNDLLGEVLLATYQAVDGAPGSPLNGPMSSALKMLTSIDMNGNFIGEDSDIVDLDRAAKKLGMVFRPGEGFFYMSKGGQERRISQQEMPLHIMGEYAEFTNMWQFGTNDPTTEFELEDVDTRPTIAYNRAVDVHNTLSIDGDIDNLKDVQLNITPPSANDTGKYIVGGKEMYRTTESLGFGVTKLQTDNLLENAAHIGNFKDELGKRIFSDAYGEETVDYDSINEFVKKEAYERQNKEEAITVEQFNKEYNHPVSEESFRGLALELARIKGELMENHNVKKFHSDIIVWDNEARIAGEIDVLAELNDGSFTVIDIKTRRKGTDNYEQHLEGYWSTEEKHTLQTNTYSNAMGKMGFRMNAPKIIMSQPEYPDDVKVNKATFVEIEGNDLVMLVDLQKVSSEQMYDEKGQLTWRLDTSGPAGSFDGDLAVKSSAARNKYRLWRQGERVKEGLIVAGPQLNYEEASSQLRENIIKVQNTLQQYTNFVAKNPAYGTISIELEAVLEKIKETTGEDVDELAMEEAINIATNFFKYAAVQLQQLQVELKNSIGDIEDKKATYLRIKNYKGVFAVAQELFETIEALNYAMEVDSEELEQAREEFSIFEGVSTTLQTDLNIALKDLYRSVIAETYLGSKGEIKMMNKIRKEAEAKFGNDEEKIQAFINEERSKDDYAIRVKEESREEVNKLINAPVNDISMAAFMFNSDVSINNDYVQLFHNMLLNAEQRFSTVANEKVVELAQLAAKLNLSDDDIKALIVTDANGDSFLMSDYKIEFHNEVQKRKRELRDARLAAEEEGLTDKEKGKANLKVDKLEKAFRKWYDNNTIRGRERTPTDEWKTDYSVLSEDQKEALQAFKDITIANQGRIQGKSLIMSNSHLGTHYFRLPGVLKTTFGHAFDGELVSVAKKYWNQATKIEMGDVEEGQTAVEKGDKLDEQGNPIVEETVRKMPTGLDGKPIFTVPIFFRGRPKENQNQDLFTIYALELQNGIRYEIDSDVTTDATIFLDMVQASDFIQTTGMNKEKIVSLWKGEGSQQAATIKGDASVVSKQIEKMMKNRVFAMTQEYGGTVFGKDVNRIMATVGSYTAFASMSFKVLGSANNWVTGNVSAALEAVGGEFYTKKDIAAAKALYYNEIGGIVGDIGAPVKKSKINQLMAIFDAQGDRDILNNNFERKNFFTRNFQPGTTLLGYSMGEHEIHATVMLSILNANKILNKKGQYLNKEGKVVSSRDEAASLVDAFAKEKDGIVRLQKWAEYSEFDTVNKLSGTGVATMRGLVKDRVFRTQGAFDKHMQSELNRRWYGKLFFQFKKHMPPQLLNRFRGIAHFRKSTEELAEDKKYFNLNAKTEEYGYYTTFLRFVSNMLKAEKMNIAGYMKNGQNQWRDMTKHERANMTKTITEAGYILGTYILAMMAKAAADDDDDLMWAMIYLLRRQTNEGGLQYMNPAENWRVLESPMAAMSKVNGMIDAFFQILSVTEEYQSGIHKGENKLKVRATRVLILDRLDQFEKGYNKRMYNNLTKD